MAKNKEQIRKNVFSRNDIGSRIEVVQSYSDYEEAYLISNRISQLKMRQQDSYEEYAILYRTNAQSRILEESLRKRNIPYRIYGGLSFYQRKEIKDAIAYFRLSVNPDDDEALKRVINFPARGIGETTLNKVFRCAIDNNVSAWKVISNIASYDTGVNSGTAKKLLGFRDLIQEFIDKNSTGEDAESVARYIITRTQLLSMLLTDRTPESISKQENLQELLNGVKEFVANKIEEGADGTSLTDFLGEVSLATDQDNTDVSEASITLMTVHAAKGLEFNNVFIVGVEEELFPSAMSSDSPAEIEEERRLLYVAITRAKLNCTISYASSRFRNGQTKTCQPSRFLKDIDRSYLHLSTGNDFVHPDSFINPIDNYRSSMTPPKRQSFSHPLVDRASTPSPKPASSAASAAGEGQHAASELEEGMRIEHSRFGKGTILSIDTDATDARIEVKFDTVGSKKLLLKFARFKIIG